MVNRFACASSGLLEKYYFNQRPSLFMRPLKSRFSLLRGKITPGGSSQGLRCGTAISLRDYQRRRQLYSETCLQFIEGGYWCLLSLWWILMPVKGCLGLRPTLHVSFEPCGTVIEWSRIHLKWVIKSVSELMTHPGANRCVKMQGKNDKLLRYFWNAISCDLMNTFSPKFAYMWQYVAALRHPKFTPLRDVVQL